MYVTLQISPEAAQVLHKRQPLNTAAKELLQMAKELSVVLEPMHPGADDPLLVPYFTVQVPDRDTAERMIARFQNCSAVTAAYLKPPDAMPFN